MIQMSKGRKSQGPGLCRETGKPLRSPAGQKRPFQKARCLNQVRWWAIPTLRQSSVCPLFLAGISLGWFYLTGPLHALMGGQLPTYLTLPRAVSLFSLPGWPPSIFLRDVLRALLLTSCSDRPGFHLCLHCVVLPCPDALLLLPVNGWKQMVKAEAQTICSLLRRSCFLIPTPVYRFCVSGRERR